VDGTDDAQGYGGRCTVVAPSGIDVAKWPSPLLVETLITIVLGGAFGYKTSDFFIVWIVHYCENTSVHVSFSIHSVVVHSLTVIPSESKLTTPHQALWARVYLHYPLHVAHF